MAGASAQQAAWSGWDAAVRTNGSQSASIEALSHDLKAELFGNAGHQRMKQSPSRHESYPATAAAQYLHDLPALPFFPRRSSLDKPDSRHKASAERQHCTSPVEGGYGSSVGSPSSSDSANFAVKGLRAASSESYCAQQRRGASSGGADEDLW